MPDNEVIDYSEFIDHNKKNKTNISCPTCKSLLLKSGTADYVEYEKKLPKLHQKKDVAVADFETETLNSYWTVSDMYTFENIGFSNNVDATTKYLICADCEMGPVGFCDLTNKMCYVALERVKHL